MDPNVQIAVITIIGGIFGGGGVAGAIGWIFRNLLRNKQDQIDGCVARIEVLEDQLNNEREKRNAEVRQLLIEKIEEAKQSEEVAKAYIQLREREDGG